jgi:hypothetical protein
MHAAGILAGDEETSEIAAASGVDLHAAHQIMRRRRDLYRLMGEVEPDIATALDHAGEVSLDDLGAEVRHIDIHPAMGAAAPGDDLKIGASGHDVARRTLEADWVIPLSI